MRSGNKINNAEKKLQSDKETDGSPGQESSKSSFPLLPTSLLKLNKNGKYDRHNLFTKLSQITKKEYNLLKANYLSNLSFFDIPEDHISKRKSLFPTKEKADLYPTLYFLDLLKKPINFSLKPESNNKSGAIFKDLSYLDINSDKDDNKSVNEKNNDYVSNSSYTDLQKEYILPSLGYALESNPPDHKNNIDNRNIKNNLFNPSKNYYYSFFGKIKRYPSLSFQKYEKNGDNESTWFYSFNNEKNYKDDDSLQRYRSRFSDIKNSSTDTTTIKDDGSKKLYSNTNPKSKINADENTSKLLKRVNADAMTLGSNIFFKDKLNLNTPKGFALLIHELTHINQLKNHSLLYSNEFDAIPSQKRLNSYWEKEALDNENLAFGYIKSKIQKQNKTYNFNKSDKPDFITVNIIGPNLSNSNIDNDNDNRALSLSNNTVFKNYAIRKGKSLSLINDLTFNNNDDADDGIAKNKIGNLIESASIQYQNYNDVYENLPVWPINDLIKDISAKNNNFYSSYDGEERMENNDFKMQVNSDTPNYSSPRLLYENNTKIKSDFSINSSPGPKITAAPSVVPEVLSPPPNLTYFSSIPLYASSDRLVDSNSTSLESSRNQILPAQSIMSGSAVSHSSSSPHHSSFSAMDLESIAERVYEIIQSKIKIQKARIGIR